MQQRLDLEQVLGSFSLFSDLSGEELERWRPACAAAAARLSRRLRPEWEGLELPQVDQERLCAAAGALAYADYLMTVMPGSGADEIKVGDIAVKGGGGFVRQDARDIVDYFMEQVADLLRPSSRPLRQVETCG